MTRDEIISAALAERERQELLWGEQNHPDVSPAEWATRREDHDEEAARWKRLNALRVDHGHLAWDGILLEEVFEGLSEEDPERLTTELIQAMAVIMNWVECIGRRKVQ